MIYSSQIHSINSSKEQEYLAGWQRARAEFENLSKRWQNERITQHSQIKREIVESLIALADNFLSLAKHTPEELSGDSWAQGVGHVARQFEQLLASHGVELINPAGDDFDPKLHEAVEQSELAGPAGVITEVVQPGYKIDDLVIRPAKVKVAA